MKKFKEQTWRNKFREDFFYCEGDKYMPDGPEWEEMEAYIQDLIDKAMKSKAKSIIDGLEVMKNSVSHSTLPKAIKHLKQSFL